MIKGKRGLSYSFLLSVFLLHFIMIIQFGTSSNVPIIWQFTAGDRVRDVAISDDGSNIVVVGYDKNVHLFNNKNNTPIWSYPASDSLFYTTLSSDGNYILTGSSGGWVRFFAKTGLDPLWSYKTGASVNALAITLDGSYMVAGSNDNRLYLFNKYDSSPMWSHHPGYSVVSVAMSSDGELIADASSTYDRGKLYLFTKSSNTPLWNFDRRYIFSVAMSSDGSYIVSGCGIDFPEGIHGGDIALFHRSSPNPLWYYNTTYPIISVAISSNGDYIAATHGEAYGVNNKLYLFERYTSSPIWICNLNGYPSDLAMSNDGRNVVVGLKSNLICSFDTYAKLLKWVFLTPGTVESVDISSEGDYIVGADDLGNVWLIRNITQSNIIPSFPFFIIGIVITTAIIIVIWKILNKKYEILLKI